MRMGFVFLLIAMVATLVIFPSSAPREVSAAPPGKGQLPAVVARVLPAVVSITTRQIERDQFNQPVPTRGLGSGVIVDREGHILTNNHVVEGAEEIKVTLSDERTFRAGLVGADAFTDLAVLRIDGKNLPTAPLGDSRRLAVGERPSARRSSPLAIRSGSRVAPPSRSASSARSGARWSSRGCRCSMT